MPAPMDIEKRVQLSLAIQAYLSNVERFQAASHSLNDSCDALRNAIPKSSRFICQVAYQNYLVTSDDAGNFDVEQVDAI